MINTLLTIAAIFAVWVVFILVVARFCSLSGIGESEDE